MRREEIAATVSQIAALLDGAPAHDALVVLISVTTAVMLSITDKYDEALLHRVISALEEAYKNTAPTTTIN